MPLSALAFLALYSTALLAALSGSGTAAFLAYQLVYFTNPQSRWWSYALPQLSWSLITVVFMLLSVFLTRSSSPHPSKLRGVPQTKWLVLCVALNVCVIPLAVAPAEHERVLVEFLKLAVIIGAAFKLLNSHRRIMASLWAYLVGCAYIGWEANSVGRNSGGRVEGIGPVDSPDSNGTASILVPAIPIMLCLFSTGSTRTRVAIAFLGVFVVNGLVLINSRGAFLGAALGGALVFYTLLRSRQQRGRQRLVAVLSVCAALAGGLALTDDLFWERMGTLQAIEEDPENGAKRLDFWRTSLTVAADYPLGGGARAFAALSPIYLEGDPAVKQSGSGVSGVAVHSTWFQTLTEVGWLGLLAFVLLCLSCIRATGEVRRRGAECEDLPLYWLAVALQCGFIGYLLTVTFMDRYRAEVLYWFVLYTGCLYSVAMVRGAGSDGNALSLVGNGTSAPRSGAGSLRGGRVLPSPARTDEPRRTASRGPNR